MRYILTGEYKEGDTYADVYENLEELGETLMYISRHDGEDGEVLECTIKIETEYYNES